jgi:hypothetical protein
VLYRASRKGSSRPSSWGGRQAGQGSLQDWQRKGLQDTAHDERTGLLLATSTARRPGPPPYQAGEAPKGSRMRSPGFRSPPGRAMPRSMGGKARQRPGGPVGSPAGRQVHSLSIRQAWYNSGACPSDCLSSTPLEGAYRRGRWSRSNPTPDKPGGTGPANGSAERMAELGAPCSAFPRDRQRSLAGLLGRGPGGSDAHPPGHRPSHWNPGTLPERDR